MFSTMETVFKNPDAWKKGFSKLLGDHEDEGNGKEDGMANQGGEKGDDEKPKEGGEIREDEKPKEGGEKGEDGKPKDGGEKREDGQPKEGGEKGEDGKLNGGVESKRPSEGEKPKRQRRNAFSDFSKDIANKGKAGLSDVSGNIRSLADNSEIKSMGENMKNIAKEGMG